MSAAPLNAAAKAVSKASAASATGAARSSSAVSPGKTAVLSAPPSFTRVPLMRPNPATLGATFIPVDPLPDVSKLPPRPRIFNKKPRLHPYWKLHPTRKWRDFAPFVTKAVFSFDPATEGSSGVRELFRHAYGEGMRKRFSKCKVERVVFDDGREASVSLTWANGKSETAVAQWRDFEDILDTFEPTRQRLQWAEEDVEMT